MSDILTVMPTAHSANIWDPWMTSADPAVSVYLVDRNGGTTQIFNAQVAVPGVNFKSSDYESDEIIEIVTLQENPDRDICIAMNTEPVDCRKAFLGLSVAQLREAGRQGGHLYLSLHNPDPTARVRYNLS